MTPVAKVAVTARYETASNAEDSVIAVGKKLEATFGFRAERLRRTAAEMGWKFEAIPGKPGERDTAMAWVNLTCPARAVKAVADMGELAIGMLADVKPLVSMSERLDGSPGWGVQISITGTVR